MTILSTVRNIATEIGIAVPDQVFAAPSSNRTMLEMKTMANKCARAVARELYWSALQKIAKIDGNGSAEDFALPTDFDRIPKEAMLFRSGSPHTPIRHVLSANDWLGLTMDGSFQTFGPIWTIFQKRLHVRPILAGGEHIRFVYQTTHIARADGGAAKSQFTADGDTFELPEDLLGLSIIWNWKAQQGQDYQEDMLNYQILLAQKASDDKGPATLSVGRSTYPANVQTAYPYPLGQ